MIGLDIREHGDGLWGREFDGKVTHARRDGALVLMERVLAAINELQRKDLK